MRITFDTNVWNRMVLPERDATNTNHEAWLKINDALRRGVLQGFIYDSFATEEAIVREKRAAFHAQKKPIVKSEDKSNSPGLTRIDLTYSTDHSLHPGLGAKFDEELEQALKLGIKLLPTPYPNQPKPSRLLDNPEIYAPGVFATADYTKQFWIVVQAIANRGVGHGVVITLAKEIRDMLGDNCPAEASDNVLIH